jgi:hypothetical protein
VKFLAAPAIALIALTTTTAHAQTPLNLQLLGVLPPLEYDYPYQGKLTEIRAGREEMPEVCPKTAFPIALGAAERLPTGECRIIIATDDILRAAGRTLETVRQHEHGHCNGWKEDHAGARPLRRAKGDCASRSMERT